MSGSSISGPTRRPVSEDVQVGASGRPCREWRRSSVWTRSTSSRTSSRQSGIRRALPGTTKYRIAPDEATGFEHLFIAGDWTDCGLNFGCVEAAVISGRLASSGISGYPDTRLIPGYCRSSDRVRSGTAQGGN